MAGSYKTIRSVSQGLFRDKGSRFISFAVPVKSAEEIKQNLDEYRKKYHDARHHCFAYMLGSERDVWRVNDDDEPSGTAGKPILGQINSFGLTDILIIVVRYFGGTLLGTSGLINAYKSSAYDALIHSTVIELNVMNYYLAEFPYDIMNKVMKIIKEESIIQSDQDFGLECRTILSFSVESDERILAKFGSLEKVKLTFIKTV